MQCNRRTFLHVSTTSTLAALWPGIRSFASGKTDRPNVLWILLDSLRAQQLGCYGYARPVSPAIDQLARNGVLSVNHFTQHNNTYRSVPQYMTGRYFPVDVFASWNWVNTWKQRPAEELYISELLTTAGYSTALFTPHPFFSPEDRIWRSFHHAQMIWPETHVWTDLARSERDAAPSDAGQLIRDKVPFEKLREGFIQWLDHEKPRPFFAYLHALDNHFPHLQIGSPYNQWIRDLPVERRHMFCRSIGEFSKEDQEILRGLYDASLLYVDEEIARVMEALDKRGLLDETLIIIGSDHGELLGEDGRNVGHLAQFHTDEVLHTPLIMTGPGIPAGVRIDALTENVDIVPTLMDVLDISKEANFQGISLKSVMSDPELAKEWRSYTFTSFYEGKNDWILRTNQVKYIRNESKTKDDSYWQAPDKNGQRQKIEHSSREDFQYWINHDIVPIYEQWSNLPPTEPQVFRLRIKRQNLTGPPGSFTVGARGPDGAANDNQWNITPTTLESIRIHEDAPEIEVTFSLPNDTFLVELELEPYQKIAGRMAEVCIQVREISEPEFRTLRWAADRQISRYVPLGQYTVSDGRFRIVLDDCEENTVARIKCLRFVPVHFLTNTEMEDSSYEREMQLQTLGYL
jgi:arylsulfatase A-like enzyme